MSGNETDRPGTLPTVQSVGYGRPPVEHQFKKGRSGNPNGRPRGARNKPREPFDPVLQPTKRLILEEAYRPVQIREGEKVLELPAIQAVMRAMGVSAMKGNRLAQKTLAEIVQRVEAEKNAEHTKVLEGAMDYKIAWEREIERCKALGLPDPTPLPHPDDILIDYRTGAVKTLGPMSKEEKISWDKRLARREEAQAEVSDFATRHRSARTTKNKDFWLAEWHFEQRIFDLINDSLPERYKAKLADRSWHPTASREGKTLKEFVENRARPKSKRRLLNDWVEE